MEMKKSKIKKKHVDPKSYSSFLRKEKPTRNPMSQFSVRPANLTFESQDPEEEVLLMLRRHFITNVPWIVGFLFMIIAPLFFGYFPLIIVIPASYKMVTVLFWYVFSFGFVFERFVSWYFNVYIVTDERVIDVDFYSLIYKNVSSAKIDKIEDVTYTVGGTLRSLLGFGSVKIQTAAEKLEFEFEDVPHPEKVTSLLNELMLQEEQEAIEGRVR